MWIKKPKSYIYFSRTLSSLFQSWKAKSICFFFLMNESAGLKSSGVGKHKDFIKWHFWFCPSYPIWQAESYFNL